MFTKKIIQNSNLEFLYNTVNVFLNLIILFRFIIKLFQRIQQAAIFKLYKIVENGYLMPIEYNVLCI